MEKLLALLLSLLMLLGLCACGAAPAAPAEETEAPVEETGEPAEEAAQSAEETAEPAQGVTETAQEPEEATAGEAAEATPPADYTPDFRFTTLDADGKEWTESCFASAKLTLINFWEPWCPPCVGEMPDLQRLQEDYKDKGLLILGVYSTLEMREEAMEVVKDAGVTYPILEYVGAFDQFQSGYVPTSVFVDGEGHVVGETQVGSRSYEAWAALVEDLL